jgi:TetR/AcrR family transcriptional regulator, transcriptional repressor for nem operon
MPDRRELYSGSEMTNSLERAPEGAAGQPAGKRQRLIGAASQLLHQQGVEKTTLAEIAQAADVPAGNVYYYFKTKDDIVAAVIEAHVQQARAALAAIDSRHRSPRSRLNALVGEYADQSEVIALYGCPHGSLCSELDKRPASPDFAVAELMRVPIEWAQEQFRALGRRDARDLAVSLIAAYEGSALLANTFRDPDILAREARRLNRWIDTL